MKRTLSEKSCFHHNILLEMESNCASSWILLFVFCYIFVSNVVRCDDYDYDYDYDALVPAPLVTPAPTWMPRPVLSNVLSVIDFGAQGDSVTDNTQAFADTWKNACVTGDSTIVVPDGTYFLNSIQFQGPCNGPIEFQLVGTLAASPDPSLGQDYWIMFANVDSLTISGTGVLDGKGGAAWEHKRVGNYLDVDLSTRLDEKQEPPVSIKLKEVTNSVIDGITSANSKMFHINIHYSQNIIVQNIKIIAPVDSPNTDGIHIARSNNIKIYNITIGTGDDCISIGDGSTNVDINKVQCGPGHGISIGSLGKYKNEQDVSGIAVADCDLTGTTNGLRIKSWASPLPSSAYNITFSDIRLMGVKNPIIIDQHYCPHSSCKKEGESSVAIRDVKFINIQGESALPQSIILDCSQTTPCKGIEFSQVKLTLNGGSTTATCANAEIAFLEVDQIPSQCSA